MKSTTMLFTLSLGILMGITAAPGYSETQFKFEAKIGNEQKSVTLSGMAFQPPITIKYQSAITKVDLNSPEATVASSFLAQRASEIALFLQTWEPVEHGRIRKTYENPSARKQIDDRFAKFEGSRIYYKIKYKDYSIVISAPYEAGEPEGKEKFRFATPLKLVGNNWLTTNELLKDVNYSIIQYAAGGYGSITTIAK